MNLPSHSDQTQPSQMNFIRFEVQRCIQVLFGHDKVHLPLDPRQIDAVLEPVWNEIGLDDHPSLSLITTVDANGVEHALVDHCDGDIYLAADAGGDPTCEISSGKFAGESWRVVAYDEGFPHEPYQLATSDHRDAADATCRALQALLAPARVVIGLEGGLLQFACADRSASVLVMDSSFAHLNQENSGLVISSPYQGHAAEFAGEHREVTVEPEAVNTFWGQLAAQQELAPTHK